MAKMVRWKCEDCGSGCLAPSKPRLDDTRRYCLPCSEATGRLVKRTAPTLERRRATKQVTRKRAVERKRATQRSLTAKKKVRTKTVARLTKTTIEGYSLKTESARIWKLLEPYHGGKRMPTFEISTRGVTVNDDGSASIRRGQYGGLAFIRSNHIWLKAGYSWHTLAHEMVHLAVGVRQGEVNRRAHDDVFYYCLKDIVERRFRVDINFSKVRRWGYEVDGIIESQCRVLKVHAKMQAKRDAMRQATA